MSDDELPQDMGGEDFDDMSEEGDMPGAGMPEELPEGIEKEITKEGEGYKKPKPGDEVTVHYVGTLQSDGSEFDSSRGRDQPFVFMLGKGQVIKGWDRGVATMKKGEVAKFTLAPDFAYGDAGSPPKIPEKATLIFEVELISWMSKDDLFGDDGVVKTQLKEGSGWKTGKADTEVLLSLKAVAADGTTVEERTDFDYMIGSDTLGPLAKACDKALLGMKRGEEAALKCSKDYSYGEKFPDGVTVTLTLKELYETKDISFAKDKTLMKKQVREGEGYDTPKDRAKVTLFVQQATDGATALPGFAAKTLEFMAGNGEVCDALEFAVAEMKKGEKATITTTIPARVAEAQLGLEGVAADKVVLTVQLTEFEKAQDSWSMSEEEKLDFAAGRKEVGATLCKSGRFEMALQRYKTVVDLFSYVDNLKDENKVKAKEFKKLCELNKAACYLKVKDYVEAKKSCEAVLKDDAQNVKALYRRAQAEHGLKNFAESIRDCKKVIELDPQNREARTLFRQAQASQKEEDKKSKGMFANMCKALGKGPIPEPHKVKNPCKDSMDIDESDDETAPMATEAGVDAEAVPESSNPAEVGA